MYLYLSTEHLRMLRIFCTMQKHGFFLLNPKNTNKFKNKQKNVNKIIIS